MPRLSGWYESTRIPATTTTTSKGGPTYAIIIFFFAEILLWIIKKKEEYDSKKSVQLFETRNPFLDVEKNTSLLHHM